MELTGTIIDILPITSGVSKSGKEWKKQECAIEIPGTYPETVAFSLFGEKCENHGLEIGQNATISINLRSRKFNDRYFTEASAWKVEINAGKTYSPPQPKQDLPPTTFSADTSEDLPF